MHTVKDQKRQDKLRFQTLPLFLLWNYAPVYSGIRVLSTYFSFFFLVFTSKLKLQDDFFKYLFLNLNTYQDAHLYFDLEEPFFFSKKKVVNLNIYDVLLTINVFENETLKSAEMDECMIYL